MNPKIMTANYYLMWEILKSNLIGMTVDNDMIHLSDLQMAMEEIEEDEKM